MPTAATVSPAVSPEFLTSDEAARFLRLSRKSVYRLARDIGHAGTGGRLLFRKSDLERFARQRGRASPSPAPPPPLLTPDRLRAAADLTTDPSVAELLRALAASGEHYQPTETD